MKKKNKYPYLTNLLIKLAPKLGARVIVEPEWGIAAQIIYKNGIVRSLRYLSLDLNSIASSDIAKDKDYAKFFMKKRGYPIAEGKTFFVDYWAKAVHSDRTIKTAPIYAAKLGYPLIVKPNSSSQGAGVVLVWNKEELISALNRVFKKNERVAIIEQYKPGHDYRVVALDGKIISAYERISLSVIGDGKSSILKLLEAKQKYFEKVDRDTKINFSDPRMKLKLKHQGLTFSSIPTKGQKIHLLDNANLSTGGDSLDVTNTMHAGFKKIATNLTRDMGLRIAGVDIMVTKGDLTMDPKKCTWYVIEINAAPGLDHYVTTGEKQKKIVEGMYFEVLKALGKRS